MNQPKTRRFPNNEFIGACIEFDELIAQLTALRNEHFNVNAEAERQWGEVNSVNFINEQLRVALAHYNA